MKLNFEFNFDPYLAIGTYLRIKIFFKYIYFQLLLSSSGLKYLYLCSKASVQQNTKFAASQLAQIFSSRNMFN